MTNISVSCNHVLYIQSISFSLFFFLEVPSLAFTLSTVGRPFTYKVRTQKPNHRNSLPVVTP